MLRNLPAPHGVGGDERRPIVGIMNSGLSWDEFRLVKSIAEARSLVGAAERLGVNHSTVFRRLAAVESAVGARLFERSRAGYEPTAAGEEMIALATTMAESVLEFERRVAGRDVKPTGELTVTVPEAIGQHFMPAIVAQFQAQNPGVVVELILSDQPLNLSRRDADIAIRMTNDPPETLVGRRICTAVGVYAAATWPRSSAPRRRFVAFIGFGDIRTGAARGGSRPTCPERLVAKANSAHCMLQLALQGFGRRCCPASLAIAARTWRGSMDLKPISILDELSPGRIRPIACWSWRVRALARPCCLVF